MAFTSRVSPFQVVSRALSLVEKKPPISARDFVPVVGIFSVHGTFLCKLELQYSLSVTNR